MRTLLVFLGGVSALVPLVPTTSARGNSAGFGPSPLHAAKVRAPTPKNLVDPARSPPHDTKPHLRVQGSASTALRRSEPAMSAASMDIDIVLPALSPAAVAAMRFINELVQRLFVPLVLFAMACSPTVGERTRPTAPLPLPRTHPSPQSPQARARPSPYPRPLGPTEPFPRTPLTTPTSANGG